MRGRTARPRPRLVPFDLEIELLTRAGMIANLVHRRRVEDPPVDDRVVHGFAVADVRERIRIEDDEGDSNDRSDDAFSVSWLGQLSALFVMNMQSP